MLEFLINFFNKCCLHVKCCDILAYSKLLILFFLAVNVQFNPAAYTATEGSSEEVFAVLNVPSTRDLTVQFETRDGTATAPGRP